MASLPSFHTFFYPLAEDELKELQSMTFKRGTLWLLEQIDINKRTIDGRIAQYMTTKGVEGRIYDLTNWKFPSPK